MSTTYSIDLGIHADASGGHAGSARDPYPLQIAVTQGALLPEEQKDGPYTGFRPDALASFAQIKTGDIIIFRVFNIKLIPSGRLLQDVGSVQVLFTELDGCWTSAPWTCNEVVAAITKSQDSQLSLAFTAVPEGMMLPCYFQRDSSEGIVTHTIRNLDARNFISYLFSVQVKAVVGTTLELAETLYFQDDPEMVISSDERPPYGDEDGVLDQPPGIAATRR